MSRNAIERAIEDAARHGADSEPEHEIGDLQALARQLWALLTPDQRKAFSASWRSWEAP
jgi:hypothetical protein